jgi:hypothetical protein
VFRLPVVWHLPGARLLEEVGEESMPDLTFLGLVVLGLEFQVVCVLIVWKILRLEVPELP